ncbi:MAG: Origin recognition complex, subunit 1 [Sclerophora amabilis]|nr:MAG: Origin recognition complex, subunit 1 [Sclerophora amabilis]
MSSAAASSPNPNTSRTARARRLLSGVGISREDSDDELGYDDYPWEWIYESTANGETKENTGRDSPSINDDEIPESLSREDAASEGREAVSGKSLSNKRIIGARMGQFQCSVGDCVLLKAEGNGEAWVGLICNFQDGDDDDDNEKYANFMWFSTEKEIRNKQKKRTDFMQNELYITPSWDLNPLTSINGKASVVSSQTFLSKYPTGKVPRGSKDYGKIFICRRGCNTRTATYTEEFTWEEIYNGSNSDILSLIELVQRETKATRKKRGEAKAVRRELREYSVHENDIPETPRKRRKVASASTPKSGRSARGSKFITPTHRRVVVKKPLEITPLGTRILSPSNLFSSPYQIARSKLHVAAVPTTLPCREQEFSTVYYHLEAAISEGSGSCIYISGTPGTGKTATVREVVSQLNASVLAEELDDFIFVEINGMKVTDPHQSYSLLWEALRGDRVSPSHALDLLEREFGHPSPRRVPCVVLMDELDQLVTKNQSVMYNFFNWPGLVHSRLIVLAVANTMDLPERTLSNKISSRLGLTRISFPGYTHDQLMIIIQSRLEGVPGAIVEPDAVQFASRKVAAVSGDARRALDICRRAVEIAESESQKEDDDDPSLPPTPSKHAKTLSATPSQTSKARPTTDLVPSANGQGRATGTKTGRVTIATIKQAINEATSSPLQQYLRCLPLSSKLFLAAVLARVRRTGIGESLLGDVMEEAKRIGKMADNAAIQTFLLADTLVGAAAIAAADTAGAAPRGSNRPGRGNPNKASSVVAAARVLGMSGAAVELAEAGVIGVEARKGERTGKVRLNIGEEEVRLALRDDAEVRGLGFAS